MLTKKKIEEIVGYLEKINDENLDLSKIKKILKILKYDPHMDYFINILENSVLFEMMSEISGALWQKVEADFDEYAPRNEKEKEEMIIINEQYKWIVDFINLTELYEGEPEIKEKITKALNGLKFEMAIYNSDNRSRVWHLK
jgi:hypothetical protein